MDIDPKTGREVHFFTKKAITVAVFSAAAILGGLIKIPSPIGSIALDSMPGFFVAVYYGPLLGAIVGGIGHLGSAATVGFPLGGLLHVNVAVHMMAWCAIYGVLARAGNRTWTLYAAALVAIVLNSVGSPFLLIPVGLPFDVAWKIIPFLFVASAVNVVGATLAAKFLAKLDVGGI